LGKGKGFRFGLVRGDVGVFDNGGGQEREEKAQGKRGKIRWARRVIRNANKGGPAGNFQTYLFLK